MLSTSRYHANAYVNYTPDTCHIDGGEKKTGELDGDFCVKFAHGGFADLLGNQSGIFFNEDDYHDGMHFS